MEGVQPQNHHHPTLPQPWWKPHLEPYYLTFALPQPFFPSENTRPWNEQVQITEDHENNNKSINMFPDLQCCLLNYEDQRPANRTHLEYIGDPQFTTEQNLRKQPIQTRTRSIRWKPTISQRKIIRRWMLGCRLLYNWALKTLKRQYKRDGKCAIYPGNPQALKKYFLQCPIEKYPKRLQWIRTDVPDNVKYYALSKLAVAYANEVLRLQQNALRGGGAGVHFGNIRTKKARSNRNGIRSVIEIDKMNFNLKAGNTNLPRAQWERQWTMYSRTFKDCPDMRDQVPKKERKWMDERGPQNAVKIVETNTGKFYLKIVIEKHLQPTRKEVMGHLVGQDPGANPAHSFYSPTKLHAGHIGTQITLDQMRKEGLKIDHLKKWVYGIQARNEVNGMQRSRLKHRIYKSYARIGHWGDEIAHKTSRFYADHYQFIEASDFAVEKLVPHHGTSTGRRRRLHRVSVRDLMASKHGMFKRELQNKVDLLQFSYVRFGPEHYGTITCGQCGRLANNGGRFTNGTFQCMHGSIEAGGCGYQMNKEVNAARNHVLRRMEDYHWIE